MSVWICREHGLYGGSGFCPSCGRIGSRAQIASADEARVAQDIKTEVRIAPNGLPPLQSKPDRTEEYRALQIEVAKEIFLRLMADKECDHVTAAERAFSWASAFLAEIKRRDRDGT